jgi:hypothetical protein
VDACSCNRLRQALLQQLIAPTWCNRTAFESHSLSQAVILLCCVGSSLALLDCWSSPS